MTWTTNAPPPHGGQPIVVHGTPLERATSAMVLIHGRGASADDILKFYFPGLTIGAPYNLPSVEWQRVLEARYELNHHRGSHDLKMGGEVSIGLDDGDWPARERGQWFFSALPPNANARPL